MRQPRVLTEHTGAGAGEATDAVRRIRGLAEQLQQLRARVEACVDGGGPWDEVHPQHWDSAKNLAQYLELRRYDTRELRQGLAELGLASLERIEPQVEAAVHAADRAVRRLLCGPAPGTGTGAGVDFDIAELALSQNTEQLLGYSPAQLDSAQPVVLPSTPDADPKLADRLVRSGVRTMRIRCSHGDPQQWQQLIGQVRAAEREHATDVKVVMDLAGPQPRVGAIQQAPPVVKVKPARDALGNITRPARIWLSDEQHRATASGWVIPIEDSEWLARRDDGERLRCVDSRGAHRTLRVVDVITGAVQCELARTCYFVPGMVISGEDDQSASVGTLPTREQKIQLFAEDLIELTGEADPVDPADPRLRIGCTVPQVVGELSAGDRVVFDGGRIAGVAESTGDSAARIRITSIATSGAKLAAGTRIAFPDTTTHLPALTDTDRADLAFVVTHADVVCLPLVRTAADVAQLLARLRELGGDALGVIVGIDLNEVSQLPPILLELMRWRTIGVMVIDDHGATAPGRRESARHEVARLCQAAHLPLLPDAGR